MKFFMIVALLSFSLSSFTQNSSSAKDVHTMKPWIDCDGDSYPKKG